LRLRFALDRAHHVGADVDAFFFQAVGDPGWQWIWAGLSKGITNGLGFVYGLFLAAGAWVSSSAWEFR
jgi:hypothetical protein